MDFIRTSVILAIFNISADAVCVISATSRGCSAMIGLAPAESTALAH